MLASLLDRLRLRRAARVLRDIGCTRIVLYIWRPRFAHALDTVDHGLSLYHVDDDYSFSEEPEPVPPSERCLLRKSDGVFLHSPALWKRLSPFNPHSVYLPNGVDFPSFSRAAAEPPDLAPVPGPRIGYVGILKKQLDLGLLEAIAERRPGWSLVLVGPPGYLGGKEQELRRLGALPNVHLLGEKDHGDVPGYVQHMDVCVLPYAVDEYTKYINPLKMYEYLAAGRPVVGVRLPAIEALSEVVTIASTVGEWIQALEASMRPEATAAEPEERRRSVARRHDWGALTRRVAGTIADGLDIALPAEAP